jgi:hypothetical protein
MLHDLRHWMTLSDYMTEGLRKDFVFSNWGYWIEPDGRFVPVGRHQHYTVHPITDETFAAGRIRCTAITDPSVVKSERGIKLLTANFYTDYVTKAALQSLMMLVKEYEFDEYHISAIIVPKHLLGNYDRDLDVDPRSVMDATTRSAAMASMRAFLATAR